MLQFHFLNIQKYIYTKLGIRSKRLFLFLKCYVDLFLGLFYNIVRMGVYFHQRCKEFLSRGTDGLKGYLLPSKNLTNFVSNQAILFYLPKISRIAGRNITNLSYADQTTLMAENEEELKSLLMRVKVVSGKASLKLNIQKTKVMASGSITSWQTDGEKMETVTDFIFLGSKTTIDGNCSHEIKRSLLLGRNAITNLAY